MKYLENVLDPDYAALEFQVTKFNFAWIMRNL